MILSVCSLGEDDSDNVEQKDQDDCKEHTKITSLIKAVELFEYSVYINGVRCYQNSSTERCKVVTQTKKTMFGRVKTNL